jgi:hypothetical protein
MADGLTPREIKGISEATSLAESGNAARLLDLVYGDQDFNHHTKIINEMLNLNHWHVQSMQIEGESGSQNGSRQEQVRQLQLSESEKQVNGETIIKRSIKSGGRTIYSESWNDSAQRWIDSGSSPVPTGIIPPFIRTDR